MGREDDEPCPVGQGVEDLGVVGERVEHGERHRGQQRGRRRGHHLDLDRLGLHGGRLASGSAVGELVAVHAGLDIWRSNAAASWS
jgi:hypothetical protein